MAASIMTALAGARLTFLGIVPAFPEVDTDLPHRAIGGFGSPS